MISALRARLVSALALLTLLALAPASLRAQAPDAPPAEMTPTLPIDEVRVGMKGYGLTVFHGAKVEPFAVEVVSVMRDFAPRRGAIWIRCPDERMQESGPVQGMSGSPIYLWGEGEPQELGKGGRLIGAFAFGYADSKDCYVGVQPIALMRETGGRAPEEGAANPAAQQPTAGTFERSTLHELMRSPAARELGGEPWRAAALERLLLASYGRSSSAEADAAPAERPLRLAPGVQGVVTRAMLPLPVPSAELAAALRPVLEPLGLTPMQTPIGAIAGSPPPGVDPETIELAPGSVLSIPLAWGDADLSATGTVTEVLPDGRVLAFGHSMFGQGPAAVPMATGYVHMVIPAYGTSFKLGGSAVVRGAIVRDEKSAIVGRPEASFDSAPARVVVRMADQEPQEYDFQIVHQKSLTPLISAIVAIQSATAVQNQPIESTTRLSGTMTFAGGREVKIDSLLPDAEPVSLLMQIAPPVSVMLQNPHESMMLESMDLAIDVEPVLRVATLVDARVDRAEAAPGDTLGINIRIQPYGKPAESRRIEFTIPEVLPEGEYQLEIADAQSYLRTLMMSRPHLLNTTNADELHAMVQRILGVSSDALYVMMHSQEVGLALGRQELPRLPSSRRALLAAPTSSLGTPYGEFTQKIVPMDQVVEGQLTFTLRVRKDLTRD